MAGIHMIAGGPVLIIDPENERKYSRSASIVVHHYHLHHF